MWQGKDFKRTFLLQAQFICLHPLPIFSIAQFLPLSPLLSGFLFGDHGEGWGFFWGGEGGLVLPGQILAASLSSGKKAGFSDINGSVGGMAGGVG